MEERQIMWEKSQKGKDVPIIDGFSFISKGGMNGNGQVAYWICDTTGCNVRETTKGRELVTKKIKTHEHPPRERFIIKRRFNEVAKEKVRESGGEKSKQKVRFIENYNDNHTVYKMGK